ncbi:MAG: dihydrodipicolinate reductase C-terminal domain-containing protein [Christensenellales bacterium]
MATKDSPSGTAKLLARKSAPCGTILRRFSTATVSGTGRNRYIFGKGRNDCGEHEVIFAGDDEAVIVKHVSYSRKVFAREHRSRPFRHKKKAVLLAFGSVRIKLRCNQPKIKRARANDPSDAFYVFSILFNENST